jgi:hypothetical protein
VKIAGKAVAIILTEDGRQVIRLASASLPDTNLLLVDIAESEDLGLWIRIYRDQTLHYFLLRWEYILGIDLPAESGKLVGLKV